MKKRIIDKHTIKVFITKDDLKQNGITALDLLGDHNQIEHFFYKILNKVDTNHEFVPHEPLTFRILPNKKGLNIIITCHNKSKGLSQMNHQEKGFSTQINSSSSKCKVIDLRNFERFVKISHLLKLNQGTSQLYHYHNDYYLVLKFNNDITNTQMGKIRNKLAMAYEYGTPSSISADELKHKGKVIMSDRALEKGRHYFH